MLWHKIQGAGGFSVDTAWNLAYASYSGTSFSVATQEAVPIGLFFKPDGTKMYISGQIGRDVNEYDLSTAWDVSTASYVQRFSISAQDSEPGGLFFKSDGTKMYIAGNDGNDVNEYDLSTGWDISTASYLQNFSVSSQVSSPQGLFFKSDGTKMFVLDLSGDDVNEYSLSTAWDISTASYVQVFSVVSQDSGPQDLHFKPDGTKMFFAGTQNDSIYEYNLSTAWDVSTASYVQSFSVSSQENNPHGLFFNPDGSQMFVVGTTNDTVYAYDIG